MAIELCFFKKEEEEEDGQNVGIIFSDIMYILHHNTTNFSHINIIKSDQIESENEQILYYYTVFNGDRP